MDEKPCGQSAPKPEENRLRGKSFECMSLSGTHLDNSTKGGIFEFQNAVWFVGGG